MTETAFTTQPLEIEPSFLDYNGHVNMAYHLVLVDRSLDLAFARFKAGPGHIADGGMTTFSVESHVRYLREIAKDDEIRGRVTMLGCDAKRVGWAVELVRGDGAVSTTVEGLSLSISLASRRVQPFPEEVRALIEAQVARDAPAKAALGWLGRRVSLDGKQ